MRDQTAHDVRRGTTPADPGTNLTAEALTDDDRAALYPTVPADPPAVEIIDRHLLATADYHAPPATRRDDARALHAALTADAAPYDAGDAPVASRPLPVHDDLQQARTGRPTPHLDAVKAELDQAVSLLAQIGDAISPTGERPEEALGTLVADIEAVVEQRDQAVDDVTRLKTHLVNETDRLRGHLTRARNERDDLAAERDKLVETIARLVSLPPEEIAKAYSVGYGAALVSPAPRAQDGVPALLAETLRQRDQLVTTLASVLGNFGEKGHPGRPCIRTGWVSEETFAQWHAVLSGVLASDPAPAQGLDDLTDRLAAALDAWAHDWHRRRKHGATPAQPADAALLAAYEAHRPTADRLDQAAGLRPADWEQQAIDVAAGALAFLLGATTAAARRLAAPAVRAIIDARLVGPGGRCPTCGATYPRTMPAGSDARCWTCTTDTDQPDPEG